MKFTNTKPVDLVISLADALNAHDLDSARAFLTDDMEFVGVFGPPLKGA